MKKFEYRFESLLRIKKALEKQEKNKLAVANKRIVFLRDELERMQRAFERLQSEFVEKSSTGISVWDMITYKHYLKAAHADIGKQNELIMRAVAERDAIRDRVVELMKETKTFEKLREKALEAYMEELRLEDDKIVGDFMSYSVKSSMDGGDANGFNR